jgi:N-methylhydantoinase A
MQARGAAWLDSEHVASNRRRFDVVIEARYSGQNHEVQVRLAEDAMQLEEFIAAFADAHRREHGYDIPGRAIEVVNCRLKATGLIERPAQHFIGATERPGPKATRRIHFDAGWITTPVFDRADLAIGTSLSGPAVIDEMSATTLVPPGCTVGVDPSGNLLMELPA